jgi:hypothetical protein
MRATLRMAGASANAVAASAQNYAETTVHIPRFVILPLYIAGLVLPLPFGWFGDAYGWRHLGYVPGCLSFILVNFFYWIFEARLVAGEIPLEALPTWVQRRVAQWAVQTGSTYRFFLGTSKVGLWFPILLWVPAVFPVWRHLYYYLGMLAVTMATTQYVATAELDLRIWRRRYGILLGLFAVRYALGFAGYEVEGMFAQIRESFASVDFSDPESALRFFLLVAGIAALVVYIHDQRHKTSAPKAGHP